MRIMAKIYFVAINSYFLGIFSLLVKMSHKNEGNTRNAESEQNREPFKEAF